MGSHSLKRDSRPAGVTGLPFYKNLAPGGKRSKIVYRIVTDAHLVGDCLYGQYYLCSTEGWHRPRLTIGYLDGFHPDDLAWEFTALAALFSGCRFELSDAARGGVRTPRPELHAGRRAPIDPYLSRGTTDLAELPGWFEKLRGLPFEAQNRVRFSAYMYQQAVLAIETRPDVAFLNLISAVEAISGAYELPERPTLASLDCKLARVVAKVEASELQQELEAAIIGREKFTRRRFIEFVCDHVDHHEFWLLVRPQGFKGQGPRLLRRLVRNTYDERSKMLHDGIPPRTLILAHLFGAETDGDSAMDQAVAKFWQNRSNFLPVAILERLVHHILRQHLIRLADEKPAQPADPERPQGTGSSGDSMRLLSFAGCQSPPSPPGE